MSQDDIPRRGLLARLLGALAPAGAARAAPPEAPTEPPPKDESGGLEQGTLAEVRDPLAGWRG